MRDPGLSAAIEAAGGVSELARQLAIAQPSVSNWSRVPAERVLSVEALTGIDRTELRPDLYAPAAPRDDIDAARAQEYALLAALLLRAPSAEFLGRLRKLRGDATPLGLAHAALAEAAAQTDDHKASREFFNLFIGVGRGELVPYGSYYLTGFLHERPLARLRADLAPLGIVRADGNPEPEDHAGTLCEIMAGLVSGEFEAPSGSDRQIFERHIAPWLGRFLADLARAESAQFYRAVGALGLVFIDIEQAAMTLPS